ncbi:MAG: type I-F CRISPR-associated endoribonuclease Cas6/Csy4 [Pseudomonadales bacterium]
MKAYLDITLLPSDDIGHHFLWGKVYQQLHLALVENKNADGASPFGVTFPEFNAEKHRLGRKLRVFALDESQLQRLNLPQWMERLMDYVHITSIRETPEQVKSHIRFTRLRTKSSKERLARRAAKRKGISLQQALEERRDFQPEWTDAPFIQLKSLGNNHPFRLFINAEQVEPVNNETGFSTYGLSKGQSLPLF